MEVARGDILEGDKSCLSTQPGRSQVVESRCGHEV